ncbi:isocitrate dehydrogenase (NAD(+)) idh1 [Hypoxylon texense]
MQVRYPGSDNWASATGRIFFHFSSPEGHELIRSPITGTTFSPVWLTGSDLVFSMEDQTLKTLYNLCQRLESGI